MNSKIVEKIAKYFSPKFRRKIERAQSFESLIAKLKKKRVKITKKLEQTELSESERELLEKQLKVLDAQITKAEQIVLDESNEDQEKND